MYIQDALLPVRVYSSDMENDHNHASNGQGKAVFLLFSSLIQAPCVFELFQIVPYIIIKDQNPFSLSKRLPLAMLISTNPQNVFFSSFSFFPPPPPEIFSFHV